MILRRTRLALGASLLCTLLTGINAVPSVNVALRTSFGAPPFLLELLETAAEENATSYFPLLDRVADGYFDSVSTDQELYTTFRSLLLQDGHLRQAEDLSSFDFALSIHSAAPRIEAQHQYYNTSILPWLSAIDDHGCDSWVYTPFTGHRHCSPDFDTASALGRPGDKLHTLPFDRVLGDATNEQASLLYGDIMSENFRRFHRTISRTAKEGKTSYRVRYKPSASYTYTPLTVSGYGVELALKRTDYIVIDDRKPDEEESPEGMAPGEATLSEEELSDLRPLSASELLRLSMKAASFVMASASPFDTLEKLSQDFPKHSSAIAGMNISSEFAREHVKNREMILPPGFNALWINGVQIIGRDVDAFSLLEHLRKERKMINNVREIGLTASQAIDLLSHEAITTAQVDQDMPRYDWRDDHEGGNVIIWLNDIEKDKRYADFPESVSALMQRSYRGQIPPVRRDIHNVVIPIDFSNYADAMLVVESLQNFVKRKLPIRFGLVPRQTTLAAVQQAKVVYHLADTYGLAATLDYLGQYLAGAGRKFGPASEQYVNGAIDERSVRGDRLPLAFHLIMSDEGLNGRVQSTEAYLNRFDTTGKSPPILVNGVPIPKTEDWLQAMSEKMNTDVSLVQRAVFDGEVTDESYIPEIFLYQANLKRVPLIVPEDDKDVRHLDLGDLPEMQDVPSIQASPETIERERVHFTVTADIGTLVGFSQIMEALLFQRQHDNVEIAFLQTSSNRESQNAFAALWAKDTGRSYLDTILQRYDRVLANSNSDDDQSSKDPSFQHRYVLYSQIFEGIVAHIVADKDAHARDALNPFRRIMHAIGLEPDGKAIVVNGRIVGPIPHLQTLDTDDLELLYEYERKKRLLPASLAITSLELDDKATTPFAFSKLSNLIALSQISDVPEGIFEAAPSIRMNVFKKWESAHTAIKVGDLESAAIQIYASIDPAAEIAQRWIPIIKALSQLDGVYTCLFLNPKERLEELPIKRFYRHVIEPTPTFNEDGSLRQLGAHFAGLPAEALLNTGMDLPASWLVSPEESVHDPDNIKLSAVKPGTDIETIYELEHILIEGHSRDVTLGPPPRGAQLVLGTEQDPHFSDTIIMANLGYFQFKANPGVYDLAMQNGRSEEIFHIDSAGTMGYSPQPGDNSTEIALMSFRGATLFPRLSRKLGMEEEDVLEPTKSTLEQLASGADKLLVQAGFHGSEASKYLSKAIKFGSNFLPGSGKSTDLAVMPHADINIFSVASGHLYERMLNIMMLSVMKHTQHTVKFWFIEQFLSPSFKDFLPILAEEYGFKYEMVTYKWPHWLRGQKEKQREIWGYKILFLDVLFPLDLDKVIFVDADQIVRTDMYELVQHDLQGAPYGFTPMCDSRTEMEGFRFWKQGYWKNYLRGLPYHISALYVVDLKRFRQTAAGDRLRQQYQMLSADPASLSNLDQDLPNHMQMVLPIHSLPQEWLWCETWCSDEALKDAKTIDLCNNPQTKEPKLDRARRQVPEWTVYDDEVAAVAKKHNELSAEGRPIAGDSSDAGVQGEEEESIQERLQREDAERERKKHVIDEL